MDFKAFERTARESYQEIPDGFKEGIDGLVVKREELAHPELPEVYTLGHCLTEDHLSDYGSPETIRSVIVLYWGSFSRVAELDPGFDWAGEIWETLTHELRHHLESLARDDALEGVDYAADQTFKRDDGLDFDPWYYQHGEAVSPGLYRVERSWYVEQLWQADDFEATAAIDFEWEGAHYRIERPEALGDVHFVWIRGVDTDEGGLELVLARKRS